MSDRARIPGRGRELRRGGIALLAALQVLMAALMLVLPEYPHPVAVLLLNLAFAVAVAAVAIWLGSHDRQRALGQWTRRAVISLPLLAECLLVVALRAGVWTVPYFSGGTHLSPPGFLPLVLLAYPLLAIGFWLEPTRPDYRQSRMALAQPVTRRRSAMPASDSASGPTFKP